MRIYRIILAALLSATLAFSVQAQSTRSALETQIDFTFPDQNVGQVTPALVRALMLNIIASDANLLDTNPFTGTNTINGNQVLNCGLLNGACLDTISGFSSTGIMSRTGAGTYTFSTLSALMDSGLCSVQGSLAYRNSSGWVCLAPGTNGQVLQSGGPAANISWLTVTGTGTVTSITCNGGLTGGAITGAGTCAVDIATNSNIWAGTSNKPVDSAGLVSAGQIVALTDGATVNLDMNTGVNFSLLFTTHGGTRALANPTNTHPGRTGCIWVTQDGTGGEGLTLGTSWMTSGSAGLSLSNTAGATDLVCYNVLDSTHIAIAVTQLNTKH